MLRELWMVELLVGTVEPVLELAKGYLSGPLVSNPTGLPSSDCGDLTCTTFCSLVMLIL